MRKILLLITAFCLIGAVIWLITKPDWEPLTTSLSLLGALLGQIFLNDKKTTMKQKGGKKSINIQGEKIIIK